MFHLLKRKLCEKSTEGRLNDVLAALVFQLLMKRVWVVGGMKRTILRPENPEVQGNVVSGSLIDTCSIEGKLVWFAGWGRTRNRMFVRICFVCLR